MAFGDVVALSDIPYLTKTSLAGRFIGTLSFFDNGWRTWLETEAGGRFSEVRAWPAEAFYFSAAPADTNDICSEFLDFMAQRANRPNIARLFSAIQDDIFNLSASLAKLKLIYGSSDEADGSSRMAATEVEYVLLVCRSIFDLLQEVVQQIWGTVSFVDSSVSKKKLKQSFSEMALHANEPRSAEEISARFNMPLPLAECYAKHAPVFLLIRQFRDDLVHRGHKVRTIFRGDKEFLIAKSLGSFRSLDIWRDEEIQANGLVPLTPALGLIVHGTLAACDDFAATLLQTVKFDEPIVPGMKLYMRGYFNATLVDVLADAASRVEEGRSLLTAARRDVA